MSGRRVVRWSAQAGLALVLSLALCAELSLAQEVDASKAGGESRDSSHVSGGSSVPHSEAQSADSAEEKQGQAKKVDAWGVERKWGLAIGEVIAINNVVWAFNEYPRGANFTQVNPRSW